jgi:ribosomal protein L1
VKIGHSGFTWKQLAENYLVALAAVSEAVPRKVCLGLFGLRW